MSMLKSMMTIVSPTTSLDTEPRLIESLKLNAQWSGLRDWAGYIHYSQLSDLATQAGRFECKHVHKILLHRHLAQIAILSETH